MVEVRKRSLSPQPARPDRRGAASGIDRRTAQRLVRGQMRVEDRIDLHGMTQEEARRALDRFLTSAASDGKRCVLVITGKGSARTDDAGIMPDREIGHLAAIFTALAGTTRFARSRRCLSQCQAQGRG